MKRGIIVGKQQFNNSISKNYNKTFTQLTKEYINILKAKGRSEYTIKSCKNHAKYFLQFLGYDIKCNKITQETLLDYITYIKEVKNISNGVTINSYLRNLSPILHEGMSQGIINHFVTPSVAYQETFKEIYTPEELDRLLEKPKKKDFVTIRTWTIIWTLASTGIRARELRELQVKNVNIIDRTITVNKTKNKKARIVPISYAFLDVIQQYIKMRGGEGDDYLFPTVYNTILRPTSLQKSVKIYCNKRGVAKTSLHLFRHTFITNAVNKNVSPVLLRKITGHSSLEQLNKYYNAKTTDIVDIIDNIAPKTKKKENVFKNLRKGGNY